MQQHDGPSLHLGADEPLVNCSVREMAMFGRRVDVPGGQRRAKRETVVLAASAVGIGRSNSVAVPDISQVGARLQGQDLPRRGERLLMRFGETSLFATVAWSGRDQCGIVFERRLDEQAVQQLQCDADWGRVMGLA